MTYQAASGIFPMAVLFLAFQRWCKGEEKTREIIEFILISAVSYIIALGVFSVFIMIPVTTYVSNGVAPLPVILENYGRFLSLVKRDFRMEWLLCIFGIMLWYVVMSVCNSKRNKIGTLLTASFVTAFAALLSFGIYPALVNPLTDPRAMYGVGAFIALCGIANIAKEKEQLPLRIISITIAWMFIVFSCTYGNALAEQQKYEEFRRAEVISDLTDLEEFCEESPEKKIVQMTGDVGYAPSIKGVLDNYGLLHRLIPIQFKESWYWGSYKFLHYYGLEETIICDSRYSIDENYKDWEVLHSSYYHTIYYKDNNFIVELK